MNLVQWLWFLPLSVLSQPASHDSSARLRLNAIISGSNGKAGFQCWEFDSPFVKYPTVGEAMELANLSNVTYVVLPPGSNEGVHKPPHPMQVVACSSSGSSRY
jgi:hypothetical protein